MIRWGTRLAIALLWLVVAQQVVYGINVTLTFFERTAGSYVEPLVIQSGLITLFLPVSLLIPAAVWVTWRLWPEIRRRSATR